MAETGRRASAKMDLVIRRGRIQALPPAERAQRLALPKDLAHIGATFPFRPLRTGTVRTAVQLRDAWPIIDRG